MVAIFRIFAIIAVLLTTIVKAHQELFEHEVNVYDRAGDASLKIYPHSDGK